MSYPNSKEDVLLDLGARTGFGFSAIAVGNGSRYGSTVLNDNKNFNSSELHDPIRNVTKEYFCGAEADGLVFYNSK
jgi:hypothetical protein